MLIANMAMSDLLYPIFLFPVRLTERYVGSWFIGGTLGQALCKIHVFLADISMLVSIQSLLLITVDRFGAVVVPLRSPLIRRKVCPYLIVGTWILAAAFFSPYLFAFKLVEYSEEMWCELQWEEAFGEKSSLAIYGPAVVTVCFCIPLVLLVILYSIILIKLKQQAHPGEQSRNIEKQRTRRDKKSAQDGHSYRFSVFHLFYTFCHRYRNNIFLCTGLPVFLYFSGILYCLLVYGLRKLCYQPDYLAHS